LLTVLLRRRGWDVVYLGANVPVSRLEEVIATARPHLVILPAQQLHTAATMLTMGQVLQDQGIPLAFAGRVFNLLPELRSRIPGYFLAERSDLAPEMVGHILSSAPQLPAVQTAPPAYREALIRYRERRPLIEAQTWKSMADDGIRPEHLNIANTHLELNIMAALALGDMKLLGPDIEWVRGLLRYRGLPGELLSGYLEAYHQATRTHLGEAGAPVVTYLSQLIEK
jgi:hypothetical protein